MSENLPTDRGWAWFIMLGYFVNVFAPMTFSMSVSIFYISFLDKYQQSATMTTLSFGLSTVFFSISSLLVPTVFLPRFSVRSITLVGSVLNTISIIAMAFSPNMLYIHAANMVLGFSRPLIFIPQTTLMGTYFKKKLSFALAFAEVGLSLATIGGPAFTKYLLDVYGLQGALLLHGAFNLHTIAASLLFRPFPSPNIVEEEEVKAELLVVNIDEGSKDDQITADSYKPGLIKTSHELIPCVTKATSVNSIDRAWSNGNVDNNRLTKNIETYAISYSQISVTISIESLHVIDRNNLNGQALIKSHSNDAPTVKVLSRFTRHIRGSPLSQPIAWLLIFSVGFANNTQTGAAYVPSLGKEQGVSDNYLPYLMTAIGVSDLLKIVVGFVADKQIISRIHIACLAQFILGMTFNLAGFCHGFGSMLAMSIVFGATADTYNVLLSGITVDLLGVDYIGHVMSGYYLVNGAVQATTHVVVGVLKDTTGSYVSAYHFLGSNILFALLLLLSEPIFRRYCQTRKKLKDGARPGDERW